MSAPTHSDTDTGHDSAAGTDGSFRWTDAHPSTALRAVVVRMDAGPDRQTIYPREVAEADRLTTWLSADASAFVDLDDRR